MTKDQVQQLLEKMCLAAFDAGAANNKGNVGRFNVLWKQVQEMMAEVLNEFPTKENTKMTKEEFQDRINTITYASPGRCINRRSTFYGKSIMKHTYTIEKLYHFQCHDCKKWWSIGDWGVCSNMVCPHCGRAAYVTQKQEDKAVDSFAEQLPQPLPIARYAGLTNLEIELIQRHIDNKIPFKVKVHNYNQSTAIQELAFANSIFWMSGSRDVIVSEHQYLYVSDCITRGSMDHAFTSSPFTEIFLTKTEEQQ